MLPKTSKLTEPPIKRFQLLEFLDENGEELMENKSIDFVPKDWIIYNHGEGQLYTKFMPPPYNAKKRKILQELIKSEAATPDHWPTFIIALRGHAETYQQAEQRLKVLEAQKFCYTTTIDSDAEKKAEQISKTFRSRKYHVSTETRSVLELPTLDEAIVSKNLSSDNVSTLHDSFSEFIEKPSCSGTSIKPNMSDFQDKYYKEKSDVLPLSTVNKNTSPSISQQCSSRNPPQFDAFSNDLPFDEDTVVEDFASKSQSYVDEDADMEDSDSEITHVRKYRKVADNSENCTRRKVISLHLSEQNSNERNKQLQLGQSSDNVDEDAGMKNGASKLSQATKHKKVTEVKFPSQTVNSLGVSTLNYQNTLRTARKGNNARKPSQFDSTGIDNENSTTSFDAERKYKLTLDQLLNTVTNIMVHVKELHKEIKQQSAKVDQLCLQLYLPVPQILDFAEEDNIKVPLKEMEDFIQFELKLNENEFRQKFISALQMYYDTKLNVRKSITNILKKYLSKNLALQFVTRKKTENKKIFKDTTMYMCMLSAISKTHKEEKTSGPLTENTFLSELSNVLPNAKDWEGGRSLRSKKDTLPQNDEFNEL